MGASRRLCPFDKNKPVWSCNTGYMQVAGMRGHISKIFMAHPQHQRQDGKGLAYDVEQMNMLIDHGIEILNINKVKGLRHKSYPLKQIMRKFETNYFSDTICYMIAYAVHMWTEKKRGKFQLKEGGRHRLELYGVDMATFDVGGAGEYQLEKGGVEFWIGLARGIGIEVWIAEGSQLLRTITGHPYGYKYWNWDDLDPFHLLDRSKYEGVVW